MEEKTTFGVLGHSVPVRTTRVPSVDAAASLLLALGTDVPLGQRSCLGGTPQPRPHSHLLPGVDWREGFRKCRWGVESLQCMDSAGGHHPEKEARLKENKREPPTRVQ